MEVVGLFGGTFDPIYNGHLQMAIEAKQALKLHMVRFVPCHHPPHRGKQQLNSQERLYLFSLAIRGHDGFSVGDCELRWEQVSYTVETLQILCKQLGRAASLVLMIGSDAFTRLNTWYCWQHLRDLVYIVVIARPDKDLSTCSELHSWVMNAG